MGLFEQFPWTDFHALNLDAIVKAVADLQADIDGLLDEAKAYTDQIKKEVDLEMAAQIIQVQHMIDQAQNNFDAQIDSIQGLLDDYLAMAEDYADDKVGDLRVYVDNQLAGIGVEVLDPVTGIMGSVQAAINSLFGLHTSDALTAAEYDALDLTASTYDGKQLTATNYDLFGKNLLP